MSEHGCTCGHRAGDHGILCRMGDGTPGDYTFPCRLCECMALTFTEPAPAVGLFRAMAEEFGFADLFPVTKHLPVTKEHDTKKGRPS